MGTVKVFNLAGSIFGSFRIIGWDLIWHKVIIQQLSLLLITLSV